LNACATLALYRSFEIGKLSIVAPVSASYPVLTVLLLLLTGERLTAARLTGMALTVAGVVLVARGEKIPESADALNDKTQPARKSQGIGWALFAAMGFGVLFWLLGIRVVPLLGAVQSVWVIRLTCVLATALVMILAKHSLAAPPESDVRGILAIGLLDTSAYVLNNFGMKLELISVVSVLASLYGAVTVLLATLILKEPVSRIQWFGITAIFAGIILISL
jgi:drug/metabolite transporter (DMT)-like permease